MNDPTPDDCEYVLAEMRKALGYWKTHWVLLHHVRKFRDGPQLHYRKDKANKMIGERRSDVVT